MNRRAFLATMPAFALAASCGRSGTRLALNWKPDPQFGGFTRPITRSTA